MLRHLEEFGKSPFLVRDRGDKSMIAVGILAGEVIGRSTDVL